MTRNVVATRRRGAARWWLISGLVAIAGAVAALAMLTRPEVAPDKPALSRLEHEALARFSGAEPYVRLPDGRKLAPSNAAHALRMKVNAYQQILADQAEQRDPTFHLKAEAELVRRQPLQAAIEWNDVVGNREMDFYIEDSSTCGLDGQIELTVTPVDLDKHPCLAQGGDFWEPGTQLKVHLTPITPDDRLWAELLFSTKKALATAAHLADSGMTRDPGS